MPLQRSAATGAAADVALVAGATLRLTRLIVSDDLGAMLIRDPLLEEAHRHGTAHAMRLWEGLECPFCVGQWVSFGVLSSYLVARRKTATLAAWRFVAAGLSLNYVTAHAAVRMGDV